VGGGDRPDDRASQAEAALSLRIRRSGAAEWLEEVGDFVPRDDVSRLRGGNAQLGRPGDAGVAPTNGRLVRTGAGKGAVERSVVRVDHPRIVGNDGHRRAVGELVLVVAAVFAEEEQAVGVIAALADDGEDRGNGKFTVEGS
jgi:hypothetical protein